MYLILQVELIMDLKIKQIKAEYQTNSAELSKTSAEYNMIAEQLKARIGSENAKLLEARANKRVIAHEVAFLEKEFLRVQKLLEKGVISRSLLEMSKNVLYVSSFVSDLSLVSSDVFDIYKNV